MLVRVEFLLTLVVELYSGYSWEEAFKFSTNWAMSRDVEWRGGPTFTTIVYNIRSYMDKNSLVKTSLRALSMLSEEARRRPLRPTLEPLPTMSRDKLKSWLRGFTEVRDTIGVERILLTLSQNLSLRDAAEIVFSIATDHYLSDGHVVDFANKAFEYMESILGGLDPHIMRSLAPLLAEATRYKEELTWRHPVDDLVSIINREVSRMYEVFSSKGDPLDPGLIARDILVDDPSHVARSITRYLEKGVDPRSIALGVALAGAYRIALFSSSNDVGDWLSVLHAFSYGNAIYQALARTPTREIFRGVYHGALRVYLDRFLNIPPFKIPRGSPGESKERILRDIMVVLDKRYAVNEIAELVADYMANNYEQEDLIATLCRSVAREDADFHTMQVIEAGLRAYERTRGEWDRKIVLIAIARYIASQSPTERRLNQVADIALRLQRGESVHEETP